MPEGNSDTEIILEPNSCAKIVLTNFPSRPYIEPSEKDMFDAIYK